MSEKTDDDLVTLLDQCRVKAAQILEHRTAGVRENMAEVDAQWAALTADIANIMRQHADFALERSIFFLRRQILFDPNVQSHNLLARAIHTNGQEAVRWYRKVMTATSANVDVIAELYGLIVREPIAFSNGVHLLPIQNLRDTPQARALVAKSTHFHLIGPTDIPCAAVLTFCDVGATMDHAADQPKYLAAVETIRRTITAMTLSEANTPIIGVSWIDFHDTDLTATAVGFVSQGAAYDGRLPWAPAEVDPAAVEWVEKMLALPRNVGSACDVALSRLNLARRRTTPGDQAIDGCIALEALLSSKGEQGELTWRFRLRTARLLGGTYAERKEISAAVRDFYSVRSKVVHGESAGLSPDDRRAATKGLETVLRVVRKIVSDGKLPNFAELELGPPDQIMRPS